MKSVLQDWVVALGLRHQGTLLTGVRGCDNAPKDDPSKLFIRCYREVILNAHCGDSEKAATFIQKVDLDEKMRRLNAFRRNCDHYPHHYLMHVVHCIEIVGYKHPDWSVRAFWHAAYMTFCVGLHMNPESEAEMDSRLNADEATFAARDFTCDGTPNQIFPQHR